LVEADGKELAGVRVSADGERGDFVALNREPGSDVSKIG
jgi:hypothetical protein